MTRCSAYIGNRRGPRADDYLHRNLDDDDSRFSELPIRDWSPDLSSTKVFHQGGSSSFWWCDDLSSKSFLMVIWPMLNCQCPIM